MERLTPISYPKSSCVQPFSLTYLIIFPITYIRQGFTLCIVSIISQLWISVNHCFLFKQLRWDQNIIVPHEYGVQKGWEIVANRVRIPVDITSVFCDEIPSIAISKYALYPMIEGIPPGKYWLLTYNYSCALRVCKFQRLTCPR